MQCRMFMVMKVYPVLCVDITANTDKGMVVLPNCLDSQEDVPGSHSEACSSLSLSGVQAVNIKVEEFSDMEGGEDPVPMTVVGLKAEHEGCAHPQKDIPGSCSDTCPTTAHDAFQAISIKVEEFSDVEEVEDPLLISFPGIKAEHAVVLNEHQLIHNEYPYPCDVDNKSFTRSSRLKRRQRIRAAARSFSCDVCNKTFNRQGHLKEHQRIHSGERPYSCHVCTPEVILSNIKIEPSDSALELQIALKKAWRLKLQEAVTESKNSVEKVAESVLERSSEGNTEGGSIVLNATAEY
ncbi:zinc finger protein 28 isoform X3 [Cryptotermes secundus]|uniref:zinc finger protein 28 isoform X3 n=1 Tax=Cryptotermes secundus TaxID=105785 RepID=UPI000CD7AC37|nr:zinc finger protein 28 isoform X3 [Cryptotermes secundus]XP_023707102.1 zinc finger protein 28 isoform X3 [Cryptotermes secundus]XP_023707103.1 zinc finger protein 28 isoform X3 [Cryptotermes secundus]